MSDAPATKNPGGTVTWRSIVGVSFIVIGALLLFVLDIVKDTSKGMSDLQVKMGTLSGINSTRLDDHDRRLGNLETWRNGKGGP